MAQLNLSAAKEAKNDEFYTQLSDIQAELKHYNDKFKGKVVFCNCDDPFESNFVKYFLMNFNRLELKELIATGYKTSFISGKETETANTPCVLRVTNTSKYLVGTQKDLDNAIKWYKKGVELKNPYAAIRIARIYENYEQMEDIIYWYKQAADLGLARAQCYYGFCMYQKEKYEEAVKYFKLAANQGNQESIAHLGYCYIYGHGVNKDIDYGIELVESSGLDYALIPEEVYDEED